MILTVEVNAGPGVAEPALRATLQAVLMPVLMAVPGVSTARFQHPGESAAGGMRVDTLNGGVGAVTPHTVPLRLVGGHGIEVTEGPPGDEPPAAAAPAPAPEPPPAPPAAAP